MGEEKRKKAIITGGSHGIGRGVAKVLAENGYDVAITYNSRKADAQSLQDEINAMGGKCLYYQASLDKDHVAAETVEQAIKDLGGLDLIVCNAGVTRYNSLLTVSEEFIENLFRLNFRSYIICAGAAARYFVENKVKGNIIFIASTRGFRAYPDDCIYGAFKAGIIRGTESMALEMAQYGVRVNCIAPGMTAIYGGFTPQELSSKPFAKKIPLQRVGTPREIGHMVEYLASDKAAYITGDTIKIDGGLILPGMPERSDGQADKQ